VAVDPLVDGSHDPFRIDEQDGDSRSATAGAALETSGFDTATDPETPAVAAIELMRKQRLFMALLRVADWATTGACAHASE